MKDSIKRAQSRAGSSFAERENFRPKVKQLKRFLLTLVALLALTTGAWATDETLLTTITPTGNGTYSETTAGAVTVTPAGSFFYSGSSYGWRWDGYGSLTVTANEGYTITGCVFIQQGKNQSVTISEAPFALNFEEWLCLENTSMDGVTSIEVYGTAPSGTPVPLTRGTGEKINEWTLTNGMPAGNVTVNVKYFPQAEFAMSTDATPVALAPTAIADVPATTDGPIVTPGTVKNIGTSEVPQGTLMYYVSTTPMTDAQLQALTPDKWSADVPTAESLAEGQAYVYYYIKGAEPATIAERTDANTCSDGDILAANVVNVTLAAAPLWNAEFDLTNAPEEDKAPGVWSTDIPEGGVVKGTEVTVTYSGTKKILGVKAEKKKAYEHSITIAVDFHTSGEIATAPAMTIEFNTGETWADVAERYDWLDTYGDFTVFYKGSYTGDVHTSAGGVKPSHPIAPNGSYYWGFE